MAVRALCRLSPLIMPYSPVRDEERMGRRMGRKKKGNEKKGEEKNGEKEKVKKKKDIEKKK